MKIIPIILLVFSFIAVPSFAQAQSGMASMYGRGDGLHGHRTASGQRLNINAYTAAHRSLPFGTRVEVTNRRNGRSVIVVINDRGPFVRGRVIDVTPVAAHSIGMSGLAPVTLVVMD
jgi:rare lipoprotein A